ncbi:FAD-dependent oxidoreductase [Actinomadura keratinilytica]
MPPPSPRSAPGSCGTHASPRSSGSTRWPPGSTRGPPRRAAVLPYLEQTFGLWSVRGGMRALATALYERCVERRVRFVLGSEVTAIRTEEGRAAGLVTADGTRVDADHVVAGVPPSVLDALLGSPRAPPARSRPSGRPTAPRACWCCSPWTASGRRAPSTAPWCTAATRRPRPPMSSAGHRGWRPTRP